MAANQLGININVTGSDFASGALRSAGKSVGGLQRRTANFGAAAVKIFGGVTAAIVAMKTTMSLSDHFASFEQGLGKLGGILDKDIEQLGELRKVALKAGQDTQFSPTEAIEGLQELASKGFDAAESAKLLAPALDFAAGGGISIAEASASAASAVRVFGLSMDQAQGVAGKLLRITSLTSLKASDMSIALGNVSRGAGLAKQNINEMLPVIGLVKNTGVDASVAATSVSSALQFMAKNSKDIKSKLGVSVSDANGNFRAMGDVVLDSAKALAKKYPNAVERAAVATELFGKFGVTAFQAVSSQLEKGVKTASGEIVKGAAALQFLRDEMAGAADKAEKFKERMLNTFKGQLVLLQGSAQTFMTVFGEGIAGAIRPGVERAIEGLNRLTKWFDELPKETKSAIGKVVVGFGAIVAIAGIVTALGSAIGLLGAAALKVGAAFGIVGAIAGPVLAFLSTETQGAADLTREFQQIWNGLSNAFNVVSQTVMAFFGGLKEGFMGIIEQAGPVFKELEIAMSPFSSLMQGMTADTDGAASAGQTFGKLFAKGALVVIAVLTQVMNLITGIMVGAEAAGGVFEPIGEALSDVGSSISDILTDLGILEAGGASTSAAFQNIGAVIGFVFGVAAKALGAFIRFIGGKIKGIIMIFSGFIDIIAGIFSGDWGRVWLGVKKIVVGAIQGILATVGLLVEGIAAAIDAIGGIAGKDFGAQEFVKGTVKELSDDLDSLVVEPQADPAQPQATAADTSKIDQLIANTEKELPPIAAPAALSDGGPLARQGISLDPASITALGAAMKAGPAPITHATLTVDGQVLGTIVAKHEKNGKNGGTVPTPVVD